MKLLSVFFCLLISQISRGQSLELSIFNDSWGGGFTPIYDDLRTYGLDIKYVAVDQQFAVYTRYAALTNQYTKQRIARKRTDEFYMQAVVPLFRFPKSEDYLAGSFGLHFNGKIMGDGIQNFVHRYFSVGRLELPYQQTTYLYPALGWTFRKTITEQRIDQYRLRLTFDLSGEYAVNYRFTSNWALPLRLESEEHTSVMLKIGYNFLYLHEEFDLLKQVFEAESGWNISMKANFRHFFYYYDIYPEQRFSSGGLGIRLLPFLAKDRIKAPRFELALGVLSDGYGLNFKYKWRVIEAFSRQFSLIINHTFNTRYLIHYVDRLSHGNTVTIGGEMDLLNNSEPDPMVKFYLNASIGKRTVSIYSGYEKSRLSRIRQWAGMSDLGINFYVPLSLFKTDHALSFSLFHRLLLFSAVNDEMVFNADKGRFATFQNRFGAAVIFPF